MNQPFDTRIESWAADFAASPEATPFPPKVKGVSQDLLAEFLGGACEGGCDPAQIGEAEVRRGMLGRLAGYPMEADVKAEAPRLVGAYLEMLGREGRVADGRKLGAFARALGKAFQASRGEKGVPFKREAPKLGPNDPCPCGSGKKWKKCCRLTMGEG